jgi:hypothetical protein
MTTVNTRKSNPMDIDVLIEKVSKLPIPDSSKAELLKQFKDNLMSPDHGEIENLNRIQSKYTSPQLLPPIQSQIPLQPNQFLPPVNPLYNQMQMHIPPVQSTQQMPSDIMTTAHFEILRNKMDSIQLELVDLLRHVKDYTQRYMNATRQQDMEKIDDYINGLFEVDKKMKDAEQKAKEYEVAEPEEEPDTRKSMITRATSGIKNFLGSIGDNVAGITNLVSNTAKIANDTLSKKVLGGTESQPVVKESTNKNIISVDDYIKSNMNSIEGTTTTSPTPSQSSANTSGTISSSPNIMISSNANNFNALKPKEHPENSSNTTEEASQDEVARAIDKLNKTMNEDIENTVKEGENKINTTTKSIPTSGNVNTTSSTSQAGGKRDGTETKLTKRIELLKLNNQKLNKQLSTYKRLTKQKQKYQPTKLNKYSKKKKLIK